MKNFDTRVYSISDFEEWDDSELLDLSPDFQRRSVWSEKAKSYLIDTIIRGKPMPKILLTQRLVGRKNIRTVVDGQQRIRAILEFINGDFRISSAHNREFARMTFFDLPDETQHDFRNYEIGCDLLYNLPYRELLDIFARINTYTVKLNPQELLNAKYVGYFKQFAYEAGYQYVDYFLESKVLTKSQVLRMGEANLTSDLLVALIDGVQTNKSIESFYRKFEDQPGDADGSLERFDHVMSYLSSIYPAQELANTNWSRIHLFYSLFCSIAHARFGIDGLPDDIRPDIEEGSIGRARVVLDQISADYDEYTQPSMLEEAPRSLRDFIDKSRRRTTDTGSRVYRASYICERLRQAM